MRTALTIAGSDSSAGAGIQADLKTFAAHGVYGTTAVTAITAQNTTGVGVIEPLPARLVTAQIEAVMSDVGAHAAKTGMLATGDIVRAVAAAVRDCAIPMLVVDPVMRATSGRPLLDPDGVAALKSDLVPLAFLVTPNLAEAESLADMPIHDESERREAARRIKALGARAVIITGGRGTGDELSDLLLTDEGLLDCPHPRVTSQQTHGTGCTFAAAIAAHLALGHPLEAAVPRAQHYVEEAIRQAPGLGRGLGPLQHFFETSGRSI
jgi:hydroxymethylpyrimidine/phosphomethylpyrimidine kinase